MVDGSVVVLVAGKVSKLVARMALQMGWKRVVNLEMQKVDYMVV